MPSPSASLYGFGPGLAFFTAVLVNLMTVTPEPIFAILASYRQNYRHNFGMSMDTKGCIGNVTICLYIILKTLPDGLGSTGKPKWWLWVDLNHRPQHYECRALTS